jgi:poly-gamma-glutamate capsule biosynthesis protein CapA/YwtB (metallophosphatase superfamily)
MDCKNQKRYFYSRTSYRWCSSEEDLALDKNGYVVENAISKSECEATQQAIFGNFRKWIQNQKRDLQNNMRAKRSDACQIIILRWIKNRQSYEFKKKSLSATFMPPQRFKTIDKVSFNSWKMTIFILCSLHWWGKF